MKRRTEMEYQNQIDRLNHEHEMETEKLKQDHKMALKEKEFELRHFKDDEIKKATESEQNAKQDYAVLKKENEMLAKITDLNADIIDIKDLVNGLISKLPEINLSTLHLHTGDKK